ncbi:MAG TPA: DUF1801 domain-containing protein [Nannocystaceae bacterium]|nr:DUF1801 domain-containing protein [Nannocystaceae bacterium]
MAAAKKKPAAKKSTAAKRQPVAKKNVATKPAAKKTVKPSARERGVTIEQYFATLLPAYKPIAARLDALVRATVPGVTASIKWGQPVYEKNGPMIWAKAFAKHFGFGFWRGAELPDPAGVLEGSGDRMRHVKLRSTSDIDEKVLRALIQAAANANAKKGDPTKRG